MATVTRTTTWSDNQILSASALNGEFNNLLNALALVDADVSAGAAIAVSKISGTAVNLASSQTLTNKTLSTGTVIGAATVNALTMALGSDAQGDIYYNAGSGVLTRLGPGTSGQFLQTQGANANPIWASVAAALQLIDTSQTFKVQWGTKTITFANNNQQTVVLTFGTAFGTSCVGVLASLQTTSTNQISKYIVQPYSVGRTGCNFEATYTPGNTTDTVTLFWVAIGY